MARSVLAVLRGYKILLSPLFSGSCRFTPSCADYAAEAVRRHGAGPGIVLGARRLARCHPWGGWGLDPVPHESPTVRKFEGPRVQGSEGPRVGGNDVRKQRGRSRSKVR